MMLFHPWDFHFPIILSNKYGRTVFKGNPHATSWNQKINSCLSVCVHDLYCNGEYEAGYELILVMPRRYSYTEIQGKLGENNNFTE